MVTEEALIRGADPVLVFDGDCAFCTSCVRLAERYLRQTLASGAGRRSRSSSPTSRRWG